MRITVIMMMALLVAACHTLKRGITTAAEQFAMGDNSSIAPDWEGRYRGVTPCADCEGIALEIVLNEDLTYTLARQYRGKSDSLFREAGTFNWDKSGGKINLAPGGEQFRVGENRLMLLDREGKPISGALAELYVLQKVEQAAAVAGLEWRLAELNGQQIQQGAGEEQPVAILLHNEEGIFTGNGGCNRIRGSVEWLPFDGIRFSKIISTRMACPRLEQESAFLKGLESCHHYSIDGDTLSLFTGKESCLMRLVKADKH